ncbi:MAG: glutathione S-transferase family protein [Reyranellaceae bacterium]
MPALRIFSYLPNPRIWKATIAARLCDVELEIVGAKPTELRDWLWDFEARPLSAEDRQRLAGAARAGRVGFKGGNLLKTDAFLEAHPFGTVPAAFSPDGRIGIFESNSIARAVARLGEARLRLYGHDAYEASRIDSFLDASLVFGRDTQPYLLALREPEVPAALHARAAEAFAVYLAGLEQALAPARTFLVGEALSLADICVVAELCLFANERPRHATLQGLGLAPVMTDDWPDRFPRAAAHFARLAEHAAFAPDVGPYLKKLDSLATRSGQGISR